MTPAVAEAGRVRPLPEPARSLHRLRQLLHIGVGVEAVSACQCNDRCTRGPALPLLDAAELALGEPIDPRLQDPRRLTDPTDGSPIPFVEVGAPLLSLAEFGRRNHLQELVPA